MEVWHKQFGSDPHQNVTICDHIYDVKIKHYTIFFYRPVRDEYPDNIEDIRKVCEWLNSGLYDGVDPQDFCKEILG